LETWRSCRFRCDVGTNEILHQTIPQPHDILQLLSFSLRTGASNTFKVRFVVASDGGGILSGVGHAAMPCGSDYDDCQSGQFATTSTTATTIQQQQETTQNKGSTSMNNDITTTTAAATTRSASLLPDCEFAPFNAAPTPSRLPRTTQTNANQPTSPSSTMFSLSNSSILMYFFFFFCC